MARAKRHYIPGQVWLITHRCHKREFLLKFAKDRNDKKWSRSVAVGSKGFIDNVKFFMGGLAQGRKKTDAGESYQLRETQILYSDDFGAKKIEIAPENACFGD